MFIVNMLCAMTTLPALAVVLDKLFPRKKSYGFHLNIAAGTSIRFEPGDSKKIELTEFSGKKIVYGFSGLVNGPLSEKQNEAFSKAKEQGFRGMELWL